VPAARASPPAATATGAGELGALFGRTPAAGAVVVAAAGELELTGTIAFADPRAGLAILRRHGQPEQLVRAGARLPNGAQLAAVYPTCVVVDSGGGSARLCLPQAPAGQGIAPPPAAPVHRRHDPVVAASPPVPQTPEERREHPVNVPTTPMTEALGPRPLVVDDHLVGYMVSSELDTSSIPGLPRMALIREINGVPLTDGRVAARMFDSLASAAEATFVIQTPSGARSLTLDVSSLGKMLARKADEN
jgi:hypothetical protein